MPGLAQSDSLQHLQALGHGHAHWVELVVKAQTGLGSSYQLVFLSLMLINGWEGDCPYIHGGPLYYISLSLKEQECPPTLFALESKGELRTLQDPALQVQKQLTDRMWVWRGDGG